MKFILFDIDHGLIRDLVEDAAEVLRTSQEYDISNPQPGYYHCTSKQPDYHVEIKLKEDGSAIAKCHCLPYKKSGKCKHAVASMYLLRDHLKRDRKSQRKANQEILEEVLSKLNAQELKAFMTSYAVSHSTLRAEILSNYLHLTKRPNYNLLYHDLAPLDKYGQVRLNRNNIKSVRTVSSTLLKRTQELLQDRSLSDALSILEAVITHLHRLWAKVPQFQDQLMVELKHAHKLFEMLCTQPMAPRLQLRVTALSINVCGRESYIPPVGMRPLIHISEAFFLEEKIRKEAFSIAEQKAINGKTQNLKWITLLYHWMPKWSMPVSNPHLRTQMDKMLPEAVRELSQMGYHDDVLFAVESADRKNYEDTFVKSFLQHGLRAAKILGDKDKILRYASELVLHYLDQEAWDILFESEKPRSLHLLNVIADMHSPADGSGADVLLLRGWSIAGQAEQMIARLRVIGDIDMLMQYDIQLKEKFKEELEDLYGTFILAVREAYGGVMARQKVSNIFSHLKTNGLFQAVSEKVKQMEKTKLVDETEYKKSIQGFVFDLDGVIVDTAVHHFEAWKRVLKELGAEITEHDDHHIRGAGRMESLVYLVDKYKIKLTEEEKQNWASRKNDLYLESIHSINADDLLPGVLTFLEETKKMGLSTALGSASKNARSVLTKLGIAGRFDAIIDGNDAKASKPDPEVFTKACAALGLVPSSVVVFEDAAKGVQAAISAGCKAVGIGDVSTLSAAHFVIPGLNSYSPEQIIERLA